MGNAQGNGGIIDYPRLIDTRETVQHNFESAFKNDRMNTLRSRCKIRRRGFLAALGRGTARIAATPLAFGLPPGGPAFATSQGAAQNAGSGPDPAMLGAPAHPSALSATLTVAVFPELDDVIRSVLPKWRAAYPGVDIKIVSRQFGDHHTAMTTSLSTSMYLPDVMALEVGFVGRFAQGGGLENLSREPFGADRLRAQWVPYASAQGTNREGAMVAIPADIGPGTLLYRADLLSRANVTAADLIRSWESYVESGERIKAATGAYLLGHAREIKDIVIRAGMTPGEGLYFDRESRVLVYSARFAKAFALAKRVRAAKLDAKVGNWSNEWTTGLRKGTLATQMSGAWFAAHLNNWLAPDTRGLWRAAPLPEGTCAAYGGAFYCLPRKSAAQNKALAWALIQMLTTDREIQLQAFRGQNAFPALLAAHDDGFFDEPIAFLGNQRARLLWRDAARQIKPFGVHRQDGFADEVVNTELDKVLDRGKDITLALVDAQRILEKRALR